MYLDVSGGRADDAVELSLQRLHQGRVLQHLCRQRSGAGLLAYHLPDIEQLKTLLLIDLREHLGRIEELFKIILILQLMFI